MLNVSHNNLLVDWKDEYEYNYLWIEYKLKYYDGTTILDFGPYDARWLMVISHSIYVFIFLTATFFSPFLNTVCSLRPIYSIV